MPAAGQRKKEVSFPLLRSLLTVKSSFLPVFILDLTAGLYNVNINYPLKSDLATSRFLLNRQVRMKDPKNIEQTVSSALEGQGVELVDLVIQNQGRKKLLQFFVDKEGGVTLDDCSALTNQIDAVLEMENLIDGAYILEVSSPGVKRVLKKPAHFKKFVGQRVRIVLKTPLDGRGFFTGGIASADDEGFTLNDGTNQYHFTYDNIKKANLDPVLEF